MKKIMVVYGTRPEAVKIAPLVKALESTDALNPLVVTTGQHRAMLDQINQWFGVIPDIDLDLFKHGQTPAELASKVLKSLPLTFEEHHPDAVVVQGDTTTVASAAIGSFYAGIPVVHLEAGLRSGDLQSPFPEEANRKLTGQVASLHLAPTSNSRANLVREGFDPATITVTGNTVIDALKWTADHEAKFKDPRLAVESGLGRPMVLLTAHRRENWGPPMERIGLAIAQLASRYPGHVFVFPAHKNPSVRESIMPLVERISNVIVTEPLDYPEFVHAQRWADLVLTDSGGVQEEAPSLGKPVLVLRENTERPEAVTAGTVKLIGTETDRIVCEAASLIEDPIRYCKMSHAVNPYGDGYAAKRSAAAIAELLGVGTRLPEFTVR